MVLFSQASSAAQLEATAEAAVGVRLRLGLSLGDLVAAIRADPAMAHVPAKVFQAHRRGEHRRRRHTKAAVSAMVYAGVGVTGRLST